jgi:hypothetical protein
MERVSEEKESDFEERLDRKKCCEGVEDWAEIWYNT